MTSTHDPRCQCHTCREDRTATIDFSAWSDAQLEIGLRVGRKAGRRSAETLPPLIAEMERRGLDTTDHATAALVDAFFQDLG